MQRTLFLHIGLSKTASTYLQHGIFQNVPHLRTSIMPKDRLFVRPENERLLSSIFGRSNTIWRFEGRTLLDALFGADWRDDPRDLLLSDEAIGRTASRPGLLGAHLAAMKESLREQGVSRVRIACFVRRQDHWLASHYAQISDRREKAGQADFERMVASTLDPWDEGFTFGALLDHAATYRVLREAVGAAQVAFMPMEWLEENPEAVIDGLANWVEMNPDQLEVATEKTNVRSNGTLSWDLRPTSQRQKLFWMARRKPGTIVLTPELSRCVLDRYAETNSRLADATGLDLESLGYFGDERRSKKAKPTVSQGRDLRLLLPG